jgi:hypothetical protein
MGETTRRDFLKLSGAAALGALALRFPDSSWVPQEQTRLFEAGLGDYFDVWTEGKKIEDTLGVNPPLFEEIYKTLNGVASGRIDSFDPSVSLLRDEWGGKENQIVDSALKYADEISLEIDGSKVQDTEPEVRSFLRHAAKSYPLHMLALPNKVVLAPNGGLAGWDFVQFTTTHDPEQAAVSWIHEATHELDGYWERIKPFARKKAFIEYIKTYYQSIQEALKYYMSLPEEKAIRISKNADVLEIDIPLDSVNDIPLVSIWGFDNEKLGSTTVNKDLEAQISTWAVRLGISPNFKLDSVDYGTLVKAWSIFVHRVGKRLIAMNADQRDKLLQRDPSVDDIINAALYGLNMPDYGIFFEGLLSSIGHFLVGPVQAREGGLPDSPFETEFSPLVVTDIKLQQVRLASFSQLPSYASYSQIRESFDLPRERPETGKEKARRLLITTLATEGALFVTSKVLETITNRFRYQKHLQEFSNKVREKMFRGRKPELIDNDEKAKSDIGEGDRVSLREAQKVDSFELDTFEPTIVVLTGKDCRDSIIVFPAINGATNFDYGKYSNNLGVLVTGQLFGGESNEFKVAHTPNYGYSDVRGPGIIPGKPYGMHWQKGLSLYYPDRVQNIRLP